MKYRKVLMNHLKSTRFSYGNQSVYWCYIQNQYTDIYMIGKLNLNGLIMQEISNAHGRSQRRM